MLRGLVCLLLFVPTWALPLETRFFCSVVSVFLLFFFFQDGETPAPRPDWLPDGCEMLADGEYDAIVMGTGLKEAIMSGLLSTLGMKVFF